MCKGILESVGIAEYKATHYGEPVQVYRCREDLDDWLNADDTNFSSRFITIHYQMRTLLYKKLHCKIVL